MARSSHNTPPSVEVSHEVVTRFVDTVVAEGAALYRDFPWRHTHDPYAILVSEVMLQQTQVSRVVPYYEAWLATFPDLRALAAAPLEAVLRLWQGLGYNRRAIALKRLAEELVATHDGRMPADEVSLLALPGVGPATAAGVLAFAFGQPSTYLETNVRAVFLHELFADKEGVIDAELRPLVSAAAREAHLRGIDARTWNYALLDYGTHLKRVVPNPSRRSAHHVRQSAFEGSRRQKRAWLLRAVLEDPGQTAEEYALRLIAAERKAGRSEPTPTEVVGMLEALVAEGALAREDERYLIG